MIVLWHIESDIIPESNEASGKTEIIAQVDHIDGEAVEDRIARLIRECYDYRDPDGYHCVRSVYHPLNGFRLNRACVPLYLKEFEVQEDATNSYLAKVSLNWATAEATEGEAPLEREPPRRIQHIVPRISVRDPNTGRPHTTSAGEPFRGVQYDEGYGGLSYTLRLPRIPPWFRAAQRRPMNRDTVTLAGESYAPRTLWLVSCVSTPLRIRPNVYWEEMSLEILHDPDGWDELYPNMGHYELILTGKTIVAQGGRSQAVNVMEQITSRADATRFATAARNRTPIVMRIPGTVAGQWNVEISQSYVPVKTYLKPPQFITPQPDIEDVDKPVMLDNNGIAFRDLKDGFPVKTTDIPLNDIVTRKLTVRKLMDFQAMGLW